MNAAGARVATWRADHPVLELLRRRRDEGSTPRARRDQARIGLSVEGGGMRGVVSCAMLSALEDLGYTNAFDAIYGGSSGSVNAAYFLTGNLWRSLSIYYDHLATRRFINLRRALWGAPVLDVDYAFDTIFERVVPLDYEAVLRSTVPLHVSITLVDAMRTIAPAVFTSREDLRSAFRAGAWLPVATRGTSVFRGDRALDGGALTSHPSRLAIDDGCTHILSLSSRARRRSGPDPLQWYGALHLDRLRPGLGARFREADRIGRDDRDLLRKWRTDPSENPCVLDLGPRPELEIGRQEIRSAPLQAAARDAYETMSWAITGEFVRAYPRLTAGTRTSGTRT